MTWLAFALLTVVSWGVYGIFLHTGQLGMQDPVNGRYKAFLFVGIAYFLVAVLAPLLMLVLSGASWDYPAKGMAWSLIAGIVGAVGALIVPSPPSGGCCASATMAFTNGAPEKTIVITTAGFPFAPNASSTPNAPTAPTMPAMRDHAMPFAG